MSLYRDYIKEISHAEVIENEIGFIVYYVNDAQECFIAEFYVVPHHRFSRKVVELGTQVTAIAKAAGAKKLICTVIPSNKNSTQSLKFILKYGFNLVSATPNLIRLEKEV